MKLSLANSSLSLFSFIVQITIFYNMENIIPSAAIDSDSDSDSEIISVYVKTRQYDFSHLIEGWRFSIPSKKILLALDNRTKNTKCRAFTAER